MNGIASVVKTGPGAFSLLLNAGTTIVDKAAEALGYETNGYFWERIAIFLTKTKARQLEGRFEYDCESGMFCAHGSDELALRELGGILNSVATSTSQLEKVIAQAREADFSLDDED